MPNTVTNRMACFAVAAVLAATATLGGELAKADVAAVSSYLESRRFERPIDRDYARSSIESIEDLKFLSQFPDARFLAGHRQRLAAEWELVAEVPFTSERMLMATARRSADARVVAFVKGAPAHDGFAVFQRALNRFVLRDGN